MHVCHLMRPARARAALPFAALALAVFVSACGGGSEAPAESTSAPPAATPAEPAMPTGPHVMFEEPADGATVKSPVHIKLQMMNYELAAVPQGTVETARSGMAHHHLGIDTQCLPAGETIPKASPWVHFGDGSTEMDMQLPPGDHTITAEAGDDLHKAIEGMCTTITVHVTE
jgi:hypothetical protein